MTLRWMKTSMTLRIALVLAVFFGMASCTPFWKQKANLRSMDIERAEEPAPEESPPPTPKPTPIRTPITIALEDTSSETNAPAALPPTAPAPLLKEGIADEPAMLNFEDTPIRDVLHAFSEQLGINYILGKGIGGTVTIQFWDEVPQSALHDILMVILEMNGLTLVKSGEAYLVLPIKDAQKRPIDTFIPEEYQREYGITDNIRKIDAFHGRDIPVTQIIPLEYLSPSDVQSVIKTFLSPNAQVMARDDTNILILTEIESNLKRVLKIIEIIDVDTSTGDRMEIYPIQYTEVSEVSNILERILTARKRYTSGTGGRKKKGRSSSGAEDALLIIPDERSNSLIMFGNEKDLAFAHELISKLDVDIYVSQQTYIYYVNHAKAGELAGTLQSVYGARLGTGSGRSSTQKRQPSKRPKKTSPRNPFKRSSDVETAAVKNVETIPGGDTLEGEINIVADERTNALIIVTASVNWPFIRKTIEALDIMPKQVLIEVMIAEITLDNSTQFGLQWTLKNQGSVDIGGRKYYFDGLAMNNMEMLSGAVGFTYSLFESSRLTSLLKAYGNDSRLRILSSPHIISSDNTEARIDIGQEVPVVTSETGHWGDSGSITTDDIRRTIEYRSTGVILTVTPHISENRFVNLDISQEVSEAAQNQLGGTSSPVIIKRSANTSVVVKDAQSLVLGGMISTRDDLARQGIPWASKIPVIGWLFGTRASRAGSTELIILITPYVIMSPEEADLITNRVGERMESLKHSIRSKVTDKATKKKKKAKEKRWWEK